MDFIVLNHNILKDISNETIFLFQLCERWCQSGFLPPSPIQSFPFLLFWVVFISFSIGILNSIMLQSDKYKYKPHHAAINKVLS